MFHIASLLSGLMVLAGCFYDNEEALYPSVELVSINDTLPVTFQADVLPILQTYCFVCHSSANAPTKGKNIVLDNYNDISTAALNGKLYGSISWDPAYTRMPYRSAKLPPSEIYIVKKWIDDGAPDN
jgi:hypothetical protein